MGVSTVKLKWSDSINPNWALKVAKWPHKDCELIDYACMITDSKKFGNLTTSLMSCAVINCYDFIYKCTYRRNKN